MKKIFAFTIILFLSYLITNANLKEINSSKLNNKFYFTPIVSNNEYIITAYISKIIPTKQELQKERERLKLLINKNYDEFIKQLNKINSDENKIPLWIKNLLPTKFFIKALPLILKSQKLIPSQVIGKVGECGVIIIDKKDNIYTIKTGLNSPIESMSISSDGKFLAIESDLSYEDNRKLNIIGKITIIDLETKKIKKELILKNLTGYIKFIPKSNILSFTIYTNPEKNFAYKQINFLNIKTLQFLKINFKFIKTLSANLLGKKIKYPYFKFTKDGKFIAIQNKNKLNIYSLKDKNLIFSIYNSGYAWTFANQKPLILSDLGNIYNFLTKEKIAEINLKIGNQKLPLYTSYFSQNDNYIYYLNFNILNKFCIKENKTILRSYNIKSMSGYFFLTTDEKYIFSFYPDKNKYITYKGFLKRKKLNLKIINTGNLKLYKTINLINTTILDAKAFNEKILISTFDKLYFYKLK